MAKIPVRIFKKSDASAEYEVPVEADVMRWFKKEGDTVREGDELCELEAEKGSFSMDAPVSGKVADIRYPLKPGEVKIWKRGKPEQVGDTIFYEPPLCFIEVEEGGVVPNPEEEKKEAASKPKISADAFRLMRELSLGMDEVLKFASGKPRIERQDVLDYFTWLEGTKGRRESGASESLRVVPLARAKAKELGIDLTALQGSGPNGEILVADVKKRQRKKTRHRKMCWCVLRHLVFGGLSPKIWTRAPASRLPMPICVLTSELFSNFIRADVNVLPSGSGFR